MFQIDNSAVKGLALKIGEWHADYTDLAKSPDDPLWPWVGNLTFELMAMAALVVLRAIDDQNKSKDGRR